MGVRITGGAQLQRALARSGPLALAALAKAAVEQQEQTVTEAKGQTPVETGTLRASGHVQPPNMGAAGVSVTAGFGGAASEYAIYVHERLDTHHPVGSAKFLERPFLERAPQATRAMAEAVARAWQALRN